MVQDDIGMLRYQELRILFSFVPAKLHRSSIGSKSMDSTWECFVIGSGPVWACQLERFDQYGILFSF
jgi:hypothetical protein